MFLKTVLFLLSSLTVCYCVTEINLNEFCDIDKPRLSCRNVNFPFNEDVTILNGEYNDFKELTIAMSNLTTIPRNIFTAFPNVEKVTFEDCGLKVLHKWNYENGENLKSVNLYKNSIEEINSEIFTHLINIEGLTISGNLITQLTTNAFGNLIHLIFLEMNNNKINEISGNAFKNLPNLKFLSLNSNEIKVLPENIFIGNPVLERIILYNNLIKVIPDELFEHNNLLEYIMIGNNKITAIGQNAFLNSNNLSYIDLSNNLFEVLHTPSLYYLSVSDGKLKECYVHGNLTVLIAKNNYLEKLEIEDTTELISVSIKNNKLTDMSIFKHSPHMSYFDISYNPLVRLSDDIFTDWNELKDLDISGTKLEYFNPESISHFKNISTFEFEDNNFSPENLEEIKAKRSFLYRLSICYRLWDDEKMVYHININNEYQLICLRTLQSVGVNAFEQTL